MMMRFFFWTAEGESGSAGLRRARAVSGRSEDASGDHNAPQYGALSQKWRLTARAIRACSALRASSIALAAYRAPIGPPIEGPPTIGPL